MTTLQAILNDTFFNEDDPNKAIKLYEDPLALIVKWNECFNDCVDAIGNMLIYRNQYIQTHPQLYEYTAEHLAQANEIREHFKSKFLMKLLCNKPLTAFRNKALTLLDADEILIDDVGILIKLPEFYEEDLFLEELGKDAVSVNAQAGFDLTNTDVFVFTYVGHNIRRTKHNKDVQYWFKNNENNLAVLTIPTSSPAANALDYLFIKENKKIHTNQLPMIINDMRFEDNFYTFKITKNVIYNIVD